MRHIGLFTRLLWTSSNMRKLSLTFVMSDILVRYYCICVKKRMLAYLCAGLSVEVPSKSDFGFQLLLFIWVDCRVCGRVRWGLGVKFYFV